MMAKNTRSVPAFSREKLVMIPTRQRLFAILTVLGLITAPRVSARTIDTLWTSHWGWSPTGGQTVALGVVKDNQGSIFTCGVTDSAGNGNGKVFLTKSLSRKDSVYWRYTYGGNTGISTGYALKLASDGILVAGTTNSFSSDYRYQGYLIKTDFNGETLWTRLYGASPSIVFYAIDLTANGFVFAGFSYSAGLVLWTDANGDSTRSSTVSGCKFRSVKTTVDGGCIAVGEIPNSGTITAVKFDSTGSVVWQRVFDGMTACSVDTSGGGYILAGSASGDPDGLLIKIDANGENPRTRTYGDPGTTEQFWSLSVTSDGGYLLTGVATPPPLYDGVLYVVKTDVNGDTMWTRLYGGPHTNQGQACLEISDSNYVVVGSCGLDCQEAWTLVLGPVTPPGVNPPAPTPTTTIKPSPTILSGTTVRIERDAELYDMLGRRVTAPSGNLAPGVYFYQYGHRLSKVIVTR